MLANPALREVAINATLTTFSEVKTANAFARVQLDGVYGLTETDFETFTNAASCAEYAIGSGVTVSGGRQVGAYAATTQQELNFRDADLEPGDVLAVCVQTASSTATVDASLNWLEE